MKQSDQTQDKQYSKVKYIANVATLLKAWKVRQMNGQPTRREDYFWPSVLCGIGL